MRPTSLLIALTLLLAPSCGGSEEDATTADLHALLTTGSEARLVEDWSAAGEAWDRILAGLERTDDPIIWMEATRGSIQAQAAKDGPGALTRTEALLLELAAEDAVDADLFGGLAADLKTAGALTEALAINGRARDSFPDDPGLRNQADRLRDLAVRRGLLTE